MNDIQILTLAIAVIVPSVAVLYNNRRLDDTNKRIDDMKADLIRHMEGFEKRMEARIDTGFEHMELLLKLHEAEHHNQRKG